MTITESKQRISDFQFHVNSHAQEIRDAGNQAWQNIKGGGEVKIVHEFLVGLDCGTDYLNKNITRLLGDSGRVVKFASIFLHQMPLVLGLRSPKNGQSSHLDSPCELGDLQTVFLYLDRDKNICQARSVIFQAKLAPHTGSHVIKHPEQRELYDECIGFEYDTVLKGQKRQLPSEHLRERALQYIFVDEWNDQEQRAVRVRTIPSKAGHGAFEDYGEHLLRFLNDSTGLNVPPTPAASDNWGQIVWDMIDYVANAAKSKYTRNAGLKGLLDHFNHFENHGTFSIDMTGGERLREGEGGFGLQFVIVWDSELGDEVTRVTEIPIAKLPQKLLKLADNYLKINEPDHHKCLELQARVAVEMARLIHEKCLIHHETARAALELNNEGIAAGLATAIALKPGYYDIGPLTALADMVHGEHAQQCVITAFDAVLSRQDIVGPERDFMEQTLKFYLESSTVPFADAIRNLLAKIKKQQRKQAIEALRWKQPDQSQINIPIQQKLSS